jgi:hypothetical protein
VATAARPVVVEPLAPARYQVRFTASAELREKLERLQSLMRSSVPDGYGCSTSTSGYRRDRLVSRSTGAPFRYTSKKV